MGLRAAKGWGSGSRIWRGAPEASANIATKLSRGCYATPIRRVVLSELDKVMASRLGAGGHHETEVDQDSLQAMACHRSSRRR